MNNSALVTAMILGIILLLYAFSTPGDQLVAAGIGSLVFFFPLTTLILESVDDK
jgi:hypothetical protein